MADENCRPGSGRGLVRFDKIQSMDGPQVSLPLKKFLLSDRCPDAWKDLDLYLFRDETVVFYVGQSYLAFDRVWKHLLSGFKGHSWVGRFVWVNWPKSMNFTIELFSSKSEQFNSVHNDLNACEQQLIQQSSPCFNATLNRAPTPLPAVYLPANARLRCRRSLNKLIHEAERVVQSDETKRLILELDK